MNWKSKGQMHRLGSQAVEQVSALQGSSYLGYQFALNYQNRHFEKDRLFLFSLSNA